ncbi:MAG: flagellar hook-associated protein FlgK [bacterium]|nr:flagellar hook-associated protein FlgK [bacterium]
MGLSTSLNIASSGLRTVQSGLNSVANNVAQADVEGYKRQDLRPETLGLISGVRPVIARASDRFLENQVREETSRSGETAVYDTFLSRVDKLFGVPGEDGSLDNLLNGFTNSIQQLTTSPGDYVTRQLVVGAAEDLANGLNTISEQVQSLRQLAENEIAIGVADINDSLNKLQNINVRVVGISSGNSAHSELLNERDRQLSRLSQYMEIQVNSADDGTISIQTKSGNSLLQGTAAQFDFDQHGIITANSLYNHDEALRDVGTVTLRSSNGYNIDLINNGMLDTGKMGALIDLRDNVLVETQAQLDEIAAGLSSSLSNNQVVGTAVTSGVSTGFQVDLAGLQQGNSISLSYSEGGETKNVTIVRVDDPTLLPLSNDHTASLGDTVIGIDFSSGFTAAATAINTELSPAIVAIATVDGLAFVDDGAAGTTDVTALSSTQTSVGLQDGSLGLPLFVDGHGSQVIFSGSMESMDQKIGFSNRISVNFAVIDDNELLVKYSSSTEIALGDPTRPLDIIDRLTTAKMDFDPEAGIGSKTAPYRASVAEFARQVISDQTGKAASASQAKQSQDIVVASLEQQLYDVTGVEIDEELTKLISLQNSYAANARILQVVDEMMQSLMRI